MKKLLLASAFALATVPALADAINLTATCDGVLCGLASSPNGTLDISDQAFGSVFNLNSLSINSATFLAAPGVLSTNTLDVDQNTTGTHTLVIDITASGLTGPNALTAFLSSFSVSGQTPGWTILEQTFIDGNPLASSPIFAGVSASGSSTDLAFAGMTFTADALYTITSSGAGSVNGGIDISVAAVPEPATWGMMLLGFVGLGFAFHKRRQSAVLA
jgi:hypothetical protein